MRIYAFFTVYRTSEFDHTLVLYVDDVLNKKSLRNSNYSRRKWLDDDDDDGGDFGAVHKTPGVLKCNESFWNNNNKKVDDGKNGGTLWYINTKQHI